MNFKLCGYSLEELKARLYSAVISDILDELGYRNQTLDPGIRPLDESMVLMGRAFTAVAVEVDDIPPEPYKMQMEAVDSLKEGEVFVVTTKGSESSAFWGELLSTACRARGGTGALVDGLSRDSRKIKEMQFPLFTRGHRPTDSKGRLDVVCYREQLEISGVRIESGDLIFGDVDGVVVIPAKIEAEVVSKSLEKVSGENKVRQALQEGMLCAEAFKTFGIL